MKLYERDTIKYVIDKYGFKFSKSLGQNFLTNKNIIDEIIIGSKITKDDLVIEIGPGIGVITTELCKASKKVVAIEIDKNLIPILNDVLSEYDNFEIINEDVLKVDFKKIIDREEYKSIKVVGNLPYYITTPIIMKLLEDEIDCDSITIMMQKEVADRIKAKPGSKDYGVLSISVQYYSEVKKIVDANKENFIPKPKVDSTVLRLDLLKDKKINLNDKKLFIKVVKASFEQRRKTILNSLSTLSELNKEKTKQALENAGIELTRRAETLSIEEFKKLTDEVEKLI